ncbi:hypothetical protein [Hyphomicrobium sp. CS1GBMeth3]|uniref:hypothetical protein n=1 Tax=Hyphomicrobium sp. CS1GBMeth3 TaxID=1892845 RepID=UPI000A4C3A31|nr:hypothetical protein [Hyphomicrobium sp. CS1GBMeth3]
MSKDGDGFLVYGAPVWYLVESYRERMRRKVLMLSLPSHHSAQVIDLAAWKASRQMAN